MKVKLLFLSLVLTFSLILAISGANQVVASDNCNPIGPNIILFGGPAIARAANGDTVEMNGYFLPSYIPIQGSGSFVHKDPAGNVVKSGTWTVENLQNMKLYGCYEENEYAFGGRALLKINLVTTDGYVYTGWLDIENPTGQNAPANAVEGIRLKVAAWGLFFNQPISGYTDFLLF